MRAFFVSLFVAATVFVTPPSTAQDFDAGWAALRAGDYETALSHLEPLALAGDDRAMVGMGYLYLNGFAVAENYTIAFRIFRDAADLGNTDAMYTIANGFYFGEWLEQDFEVAHQWYRRVEAALEDGPIKRTVEGLRQSADALAQIEAGANGGNVSDQVALANRYTHDPFLKNLEKSARWFRAAAEQDDVDSQMRLAEMNQLGQGGAPSSTEAHFWYSVAATRGADDASRLRDLVAEALTADSLADNQARLQAWLARHPR